MAPTKKKRVGVSHLRPSGTSCRMESLPECSFLKTQLWRFFLVWKDRELKGDRGRFVGWNSRKNRGYGIYPQNGWFIINGKPLFKMDDLEGKTHHFRKPPFHVWNYSSARDFFPSKRRGGIIFSTLSLHEFPEFFLEGRKISHQSMTEGTLHSNKMRVISEGFVKSIFIILMI